MHVLLDHLRRSHILTKIITVFKTYYDVLNRHFSLAREKEISLNEI